MFASQADESILTFQRIRHGSKIGLYSNMNIFSQKVLCLLSGLNHATNFMRVLLNVNQD
jgi:hypothetical protein